MEKNYFAVTDYRLWVVVQGCIGVALVSTALLLGLLSGTPAGLAAASRRCR
jgi:hypothetical protein